MARALLSIIVAISAAYLGGCVSGDPKTERYDTVILNGRVIDPETQLDALRNVGINGRQIAAVTTDKIVGVKIINAQGAIVAPGFIDLHAHGQSIPGGRMQAFDGVTTALELESGVFPVASWYQRAKNEGRPIHYGASASWLLARRARQFGDTTAADVDRVLVADNAWTDDIADAERLEKTGDFLERSLEDGALGIGFLLGYAPSVSREEYFLLNALAAKRGAPTFTHARYLSMIEPMSSFQSIQEIISVAAGTGAHMHICHLNSIAQRDITKISEAITQAQAIGVPISVEAYPYGAASTSIGSAIFSGRMWRERVGLSAKDFYLNGEQLTEKRFAELQKDKPETKVILRFFDLDDNDDKALFDKSVLFPNGIIASDGGQWYASGKMLTSKEWPLPPNAFAHPRSAGAFSRFLRKYVRESGSLSWSEAIARVAYRPAQLLESYVPQMRKKGRLQVGADADIVVFNPDTVTDRATFARPAQVSEGFLHVIILGQMLIEDGALNTDLLPGQAIRNQMEN